MREVDNQPWRVLLRTVHRGVPSGKHVVCISLEGRDILRSKKEVAKLMKVQSKMAESSYITLDDKDIQKGGVNVRGIDGLGDLKFLKKHSKYGNAIDVALRRMLPAKNERCRFEK